MVARGIAGTSLLAALAAVGLIGCGSASTNVVGPSANKCSVSASPSPTSFPPAGGSGSVAVSADRECSWSLTTDSLWLAFTAPSAGQGSATVPFTVSANPAGQTRSADIQVNGQRLQVAQQAAPCAYQLDHQSQSVAASGGGGKVSVSTADGCAWSAASSVGWITLEGAGASGSGSVSFSVAANAGDARSATLTIAGVGFAISQASGIVAPPPPGPSPTPPPAPAPPPCQYSMSPTSQSVAATGTTFDVAVTTGSGCAWTAAAQADWLSVSPGKGAGSGGFRVTVAANDGASRRVGTVSAAGGTLAVTQEGLPTVQLQGDVTQQSGSCPSITFFVGTLSDVMPADALGTKVTTSGDTRFTSGSCGDVLKGAKVHVTGIQRSGFVQATEVQIQKKTKG